MKTTVRVAPPANGITPRIIRSRKLVVSLLR
ncbi:Uncharacterised protein [Mycobacteroides abscessus subsp. abscessus]|nr:Uncharacterised protein [Mycobacteroides abscessus subsp. abscessus]SKY62776.1 Uncharacterised protein [Mycobacteroides abscessus subsp. abscessus]